MADKKPKSGPNAKDPNSANQRRLARRTAENMTPDMLERRDRFVDAMVRGMSKYQAALYAGCQPRSAHKEGSQLWCEPYVQEQYRKLRDAIEEDQIVCRKDVIIGLVSEARNDGPGTSQSARVAAWSHVSKVMGYDAPTKVETEIKGGVMVVPSSGSVDDWEEAARQSQSSLKQQVRD